MTSIWLAAQPLHRLLLLVHMTCFLLQPPLQPRWASNFEIFRNLMGFKSWRHQCSKYLGIWIAFQAAVQKFGHHIEIPRKEILRTRLWKQKDKGWPQNPSPCSSVPCLLPSLCIFMYGCPWRHHAELRHWDHDPGQLVQVLSFSSTKSSFVCFVKSPDLYSTQNRFK